MIRPIVHSGLAAAAGQLLSAASLPFLARLYAPEDFAVWALVVATVGIVGVVASARYELAVVLPPDGRTAADLFWAAIGTVAIGSIAVAALAALAAERGALGLGGTFGPAESAAVHGLGVLAAGGYAMLVGWCIRSGRFGLASGSQVVQAIVTVGVQFAAATAVKPSAHGLVWGFVLGLAVADAFMVAGLLASRQAPGRWSGPSQSVAALARFRRFPLLSMPTMLCSTSRDRAAVLVMERWLDRTPIGEYAIIQRLANFPVSLVNSAVRPVLFNEAARSGAASLESRVIAILRLLLLVTMPWLAVTLVLADDLLPWLLGPRWQGRGDVLRILVLPAYAAMAVTWLDRLLESEGRQRLALGIEAMSALASLASLAVGLAVGGDLVAGLAGQALALVSCSVGYLIVVFRVAGYRFRSLLAATPAPIGCFAATLALTEAARRAFGPAIALAIAAVAITAAALLARRGLAARLADIRGNPA